MPQLDRREALLALGGSGFAWWLFGWRGSAEAQQSNLGGPLSPDIAAAIQRPMLASHARYFLEAYNTYRNTGTLNSLSHIARPAVDELFGNGQGPIPIGEGRRIPYVSGTDDLVVILMILDRAVLGAKRDGVDLEQYGLGARRFSPSPPAGTSKLDIQPPAPKG